MNYDFMFLVFCLTLLGIIAISQGQQKITGLIVSELAGLNHAMTSVVKQVVNKISKRKK